MMHGVIWALIGVAAAAAALLIEHRRSARDAGLALALGVGGALLGGLIARAITVRADNMSSTSMGALATAVVALSVYYVVVARKPALPAR